MVLARSGVAATVWRVFWFGRWRRGTGTRWRPREIGNSVRGRAILSVHALSGGFSNDRKTGVVSSPAPLAPPRRAVAMFLFSLTHRKWKVAASSPSSPRWRQQEKCQCSTRCVASGNGIARWNARRWVWETTRREIKKKKKREKKPKRKEKKKKKDERRITRWGMTFARINVYFYNALLS